DVWGQTATRTNKDMGAASKAITTDRSGNRASPPPADGYTQFDARRMEVRTQNDDLKGTCNLIQGKFPGHPRSIATLSLDCDNAATLASQTTQLNNFHTNAERELGNPFVRHRDPGPTTQGVTDLVEPQAAQLITSQ